LPSEKVCALRRFGDILAVMDVWALPDAEDYGPAGQPVAYERGTDGPRLLLVGVDGTDTSLRAAASAFGLARRQRCRLTVVYVASQPALAAFAPQVCADLAAAHAAVVAELRDTAKQAALELGVPVRFVVRRGDPFTQLRDVADETRADMVFVGASAQAGHRFVGSIAARLVRLGRWPVVVVP
jgi:nucleotide-binding universal stress UspA family protein